LNNFFVSGASTIRKRRLIHSVAGGVVGNAIGQSDNREDCRRNAYYYDRQREAQDNADRDHRDGDRRDYDTSRSDGPDDN
jgi:hypothetical protein